MHKQREVAMSRDITNNQVVTQIFWRINRMLSAVNPTKDNEIYILQKLVDALTLVLAYLEGENDSERIN